jgi:hypothetical protein
MISFALSGMIQFESMLYTVLLSLGAAVLSAVMSYYNLYATHRKWLQGEVNTPCQICTQLKKNICETTYM